MDKIIHSRAAQSWSKIRLIPMLFYQRCRYSQFQSKWYSSGLMNGCESSGFHMLDPPSIHRALASIPHLKTQSYVRPSKADSSVGSFFSLVVPRIAWPDRIDPKEGL